MKKLGFNNPIALFPFSVASNRTLSKQILKNWLENTTDQYLVFGSENDGVSKALEELASEKIKIPMNAKLESLNVSNASSVILFEVFRQREL